MLISVIVSTYNWPEALGPVLDSLIRQSDGRFEVIIADDGSRQETGDLIAGYAARAPFPIRHFWQEDQGFRVARCRNGAASLARGDYILFMDGDCCVLADFVSSHRALAEPGWFVTGRRCFLKKRFSESLMKKNRCAHYTWSRGRWLLRGVFGACNRPFQFLRLHRTDAQRKRQAENWERAQTCNLGVWKDSFHLVDGFDASYENHGFEDSDFILRLIRAGVRRKTADYTSPVLHFYHGRGDEDRMDIKGDNPRRFKALMEDRNRSLPVIGYSDSH